VPVPRDLDARVCRFSSRVVDLFALGAAIAIARKESRESLFWLRLIAEKRLLDPQLIEEDMSEARQLTAIFRAIIEKARSSSARG
jgi:hypothetical protein